MGILAVSIEINRTPISSHLLNVEPQKSGEIEEEKLSSPRWKIEPCDIKIILWKLRFLL